MGRKKVGTVDYLGAVRGNGYFVRCCPNCAQKIYIEGEYELREFLAAVPKPGIVENIKLYMKSRVRLPMIQMQLQWKTPVERELERLNARLEFANILNGEKKELIDPKKFNRDFFDRKYSVQGGVKALESMIAQKVQPHMIAEKFGFTKQRAQQICEAYQRRVVA